MFAVPIRPQACAWVVVACTIGFCGTRPALAEPSVGQFELKDLESGPGYLQFQSQNAWSFGQPSRATAVNEDGELIFDDNSVARQREALEMEMGFTTWLKMRIGIEFEEERIDDPASLSVVNDFEPLKLTELGAEVITILVPRDGDGFGLGLVAEVERPLARGEQMALNSGLILEWASGRWSASLVPTLVYSFGGEPNEEGRHDNKIDFAYAFQAAYTASSAWMFAIEAYGTLDRLGSTGNATADQIQIGDHDQHRLGPIVYLTRSLDDAASVNAPLSHENDDEGSTMTVGLGIFAGLNKNTPDGTLKLSVEVDF